MPSQSKHTRCAKRRSSRQRTIRSWTTPDAVPLRPAAAQDLRRELARLVPLWPHEIADETPAGRAKLLRALRRALKAERLRGIEGSWTYDLARHAQLLRAYQREMANQRFNVRTGGRVPTTTTT